LDAVLPRVPRTHHVLAVDPALGQRPALVVAHVRDRVGATLVPEQGEAQMVGGEGQHALRFEIGEPTGQRPAGCRGHAGTLHGSRPIEPGDYYGRAANGRSAVTAGRSSATPGRWPSSRA